MSALYDLFIPENTFNIFDLIYYFFDVRDLLIPAKWFLTKVVMVVVMIDDIIGKLTELFCSALLFMIKIFIEIASFVIVIATAILHDIWLLIISQHCFVVFLFLFFITNMLSFFLHNFFGLFGVFMFNLISLGAFWLSLCYSWLFFISGPNRSVAINFGQWALINLNYKIEFSFYIDALSYSFIFLTTTIAFYVYIYAFAYFRYEPHVDRLLIFLNLFVLSMIVLVSASNLIILFLGWELIGLTSFFLINFWTTRISTLKAAFKAFLFNRISDVMLFFVCIFCFYLFHELNNKDLIGFFLKQPSLYYGGFSCINIFSFCLVVPICIKSAQFFWHIWLPDSMEAPVPASALIHSATLVSAGIYLILRFKSVLLLSEYATILLPLIGSMTACLGAVSSAFQTDTKRLLAYSTISHCGFLVVCAIMCDSEYTIFYLYVHGFFKAAAFICVGTVIRFNGGVQDIRQMGGFGKYLPFECFALGICLVALAGAPFSFGFFMKHFLLASISTTGILNRIITAFLFIAACFGIVYCSRLYYGIFFGVRKSNKSTYTTVSKLEYYNFDTNGTFYTNSTIGAAFAISGLVFFGLYICWILLLYITCKIFNTAEFGSTILRVTLYSIKYYLTMGALFNFGFLNTVMILIFTFICVVSFVWVFHIEHKYELFAAVLCLINLIILFLFLSGVI